VVNSIRACISVLLLCLVTIACGSGDSGPSPNNDNPQENNPPDNNPPSNDPQENDPPGSNTFPIAGFWDNSTLDSAGQEDIIYVEISPDGQVTEYDYDQDAFGAGQNCYYVTQSQLTALGDNRYQQTDPTDGSVEEFTAISSGDVLTVTYVDVEDDNNNGQTTDLITESYPAVVGTTAIDLTPCDNTVAQGTGEPIIGADGIPGHPTADLIGTWVYGSVSVDTQVQDLGTFLDFATGAVEARLHIMTNSAYFYEEVDSRGGQLWAEWGFIFFNDGQLDVNRQFDTNGPAGLMTVFEYAVQDDVLFLQRYQEDARVVFLLRKI
jgi:hypothetical protein